VFSEGVLVTRKLSDREARSQDYRQATSADGIVALTPADAVLHARAWASSCSAAT